MAKEFEEARATRYRDVYRGNYLYITVVPEAKEIFISSVEQDTNPLTGASFDAMTRMISLAWQSNPLDIVVGHLYKSSRSKTDLPGLLAHYLEKEIKNGL